MRVSIRLGRDPGSGIMAMVGYSMTGHVLALVAMVLAPRFIPRRPPPPLVLTASIVSMPQEGGPAPSPPAQQRVSPTQMAEEAAKTARKRSQPEPEPRTSPAPPPPDTPREKKKKPVPEPEPPRPSPAQEEPDESEEAPPGGADEGAGQNLQDAGPLPQGIGLGSGGDDSSGIPSITGAMFPYQYYRSTMVNQIRSRWRRPLTPGLGGSLRCAVSFVIAKNGRVSDVAVSVPSGFGALDESAMRAVLESSPLPPLPYQYGSGSVRAELIFELTPD